MTPRAWCLLVLHGFSLVSKRWQHCRATSPQSARAPAASAVLSISLPSATARGKGVGACRAAARGPPSQPGGWCTSVVGGAYNYSTVFSSRFAHHGALGIRRRWSHLAVSANRRFPAMLVDSLQVSRDTDRLRTCHALRCRHRHGSAAARRSPLSALAL